MQLQIVRKSSWIPVRISIIRLSSSIKCIIDRYLPMDLND